MASEFEVPGKRPARRPLKLSRATLALVSAAALVPVVAWATDQNINLTANVPKFCQFNAVPTFSGLNNFSVSANSIGSSVLQMTTPTTSVGIANNAGFNFSVNATCNYPSQVVMTTLNGGLRDASPESVVSGTFVNRLDYTVIATWDGAPVGLLSTASNPPGFSSAPQLAPTAYTGALNLGVVFVPNVSAPMLAGDYTDTLRISLTPQ